jgi:uncharacterized protein (DUF58 family)
VRIRVRTAPLVAFAATAVVLDSLRDLAGPFSRLVAVLPLLFALASVLQLAATWAAFGFHQDFSTDHPAKGDILSYRLVLSNPLPFPSSAGVCSFHSSGPAAGEGESLVLGAGERLERSRELACPYRGIYSFGAASFRFSDPLGIIETEHRIEARVFHVYPELVRLGPALDGLAEGSGGQAAGSATADPAVFESLAPLEDGRGGFRIAWKRWASTGIPCAYIPGRSAAFGLRIVLDLRPGGAGGEEELAAEDLAATAAYSLLERAARAGIPAEFVLGGDEGGAEVGDEAAFRPVYELSTSALFNDDRFPVSAFSSARSAILVSVVPIAETRGGLSLFDALEDALARSQTLHLVAVPPPSSAEGEKARAFAALERLGAGGGVPAITVLDPRRGPEDLLRAFS